MQATGAGGSDERATWLALATGHQLPSLAAHLGAMHGAEAHLSASASAAEGNGSNGGGAMVVVRSNLSSGMHTELTRCGLTGAVLSAPLLTCACRYETAHAIKVLEHQHQ